MAEGVPQVVRCLVVVVGMCLAPQGGVVLFSVAQVSREVMTTPTGHSPPPPQLLYSLLYLLIYYGYFYSQLSTPEGKSLPIGYITDIIPYIEGGTKVCLTPPTCSGHTLPWSPDLVQSIPTTPLLEFLQA